MPINPQSNANSSDSKSKTDQAVSPLEPSAERPGSSCVHPGRSQVSIFTIFDLLRLTLIGHGD